MVNTVEYAILLLAGFTCKGTPVDRIEITDKDFILYDGTGAVIYTAKRIGGGAAIVSDYVPDISFGTVLRFVVGSKELFAVSDEEGEMKIECEVTQPEDE